MQSTLYCDQSLLLHAGLYDHVIVEGVCMRVGNILLSMVIGKDIVNMAKNQAAFTCSRLIIPLKEATIVGLAMQVQLTSTTNTRISVSIVCWFSRPAKIAGNMGGRE